MASPVTVPCSITCPDLVSLDSDNRPVKLSVVAFNIDGPRAVPVCWPTPPGPVFVRDAAGFRRFDLLHGLATGPHFVSLTEACR